jgi:hypothetical protein
MASQIENNCMTSATAGSLICRRRASLQVMLLRLLNEKSTHNGHNTETSQQHTAAAAKGLRRQT